MNEDGKLSTGLLGCKLASPLMLASGGLGETAESLAQFLNAGAAAVVTRTLRLRGEDRRRTFPSPYIAFGPGKAWMLNCEWGSRSSYRYWLDEGLERLTAAGPVVVSISGRDIDDCVSLARILDDAKVMAFEINISCSHAGALFGRVGESEAHVGRLVEALKREVATPVVVKLGYSPVLGVMARAAEQAGADAISTTNSIGPGLDIELKSGRPTLGIETGRGGLSGSAIFPIALACVAEVALSVKIPVIGIGGVSTADDVLKMLMVGATAVQIYTAAYVEGPSVFRRLITELTTSLMDLGYEGLHEVTGHSLNHLRRESDLSQKVPFVIAGRCVPCTECYEICHEGAIQVSTVAKIEASQCTGCGACTFVCPSGAIERV